MSKRKLYLCDCGRILSSQFRICRCHRYGWGGRREISLNITERTVENISEMKSAIIEIFGMCEALGYKDMVVCEAVRALGIAANMGDKIKLQNCNIEKVKINEN